jgi:hypothetical protein
VLALSLNFYGVALAALPGEGNVPSGWDKNHTTITETNFHGGSQNVCDTCDSGGPGVRTETETDIGPPKNKHNIESSEEGGPDRQGPKN